MEEETYDYELGNCLRGYAHGKFKCDDEAWTALSAIFDASFPSKGGRSVELRKTIRMGTTPGGNL